MRMLAAPSAVVEANIAKKGVLLACEVSADMRGFLLAMQEAGDSPGKERILIHLII